MAFGEVVLGWALGLGSAFIVDAWKSSKRASASKEAILRELDELAYRLTGVVFKIEAQTGRLDADLLKWLQQSTARYGGPNRMEMLPVGFDRMLKASADEIDALNTFMKAQAKSSFIPAEEAPYAASAMSAAHEFNPDFALAVSDVLSQLRMFNEARENGLRYTLLTFEPGLSDVNHTLVVQNADSSEAQVSNRARVTVDKISCLRDDFHK